MKRSIWFIVAGMVAGFLSGILLPHIYGVHGAILGGTLAGGVLACNSYRKKKGELPLTVLLGIVVVVSLTTFLLMFAWDALLLYLSAHAVIANTSDISDIPRVAWHSALTCFLISLGVLLYCRTHSFACFLLIPLLSVLPRAIVLEQHMRSGELPVGFLTVSLFCAVVGLFPFLLLWGGVAWLFGFLRKDNREAS
jgi:hypothetical protein